MHDSLFAWAVDRLNQAYCGLRGHDSYLGFEEHRLYLRCASCGHESPGWATGKPRAEVRVTPETGRWASLARLPVFGARRTV